MDKELSPTERLRLAGDMRRIGKDLAAQAGYFGTGNAPQTKHKIKQWVDELIDIERSL